MPRTSSRGRVNERSCFPLEAQYHLSATPWCINESMVHLSETDGYSHGTLQFLLSYSPVIHWILHAVLLIHRRFIAGHRFGHVSKMGWQRPSWSWWILLSPRWFFIRFATWMMQETSSYYLRDSQTVGRGWGCSKYSCKLLHCPRHISFLASRAPGHRSIHLYRRLDG